MDKLPPGCSYGIAGLSIGLTPVILSSSFISQPTPSKDQSADTSLSGSFCPSRSGHYILYFGGKFENTYEQIYKFESTEVKKLNGTLSKDLNAGQCYPIYVSARGLDSTFTEFAVKYENGLRYVPTENELLTCKFTGCINGNTLTNHCQSIQRICISNIQSLSFTPKVLIILIIHH